MPSIEHCSYTEIYRVSYPQLSCNSYTVVLVKLVNYQSAILPIHINIFSTKTKKFQTSINGSVLSQFNTKAVFSKIKDSTVSYVLLLIDV
ncbi:hypothetical protein MOSE0_J02322 [Monosporozyma servazzii]